MIETFQSPWVVALLATLPIEVEIMVSSRLGYPARRSSATRAMTGVAMLALVATAVIVAPAASAARPPSTGGGSGHAAPSSGSFVDPLAADRPLYRFWNTGGLMTASSIERQVRQIKASGAGGFEANQLSSVIPGFGARDYDPETMSWGTREWTRAWTQLLEAGKRAGLRVDQIYTPGWSAGTQTVLPDGPGSAKEIAFGAEWLDAGETYEGPVPPSELPDGVTKRVMQGALAYRCVSACGGPLDATPVLDPNSVVNLTGEAGDGTVSWTAPASPADGRYVVVGAWMQGTGQEVALAATPEPTYLVDHFSASGFDAVKDYWESEVLTPRLRAAIRDSGGSMFFDSLELNREGEQVRSWTGDFLRQFEQRRGYSLVPYLAAVAVTEPVFTFSGDVGERMREDYNQTLSELFRDYHLEPLMEWAAGLGLTVRGQGYSSWGPTSIDFQEMATILDIPEGEDLSFNEGFSAGYIATIGSDAWRALTSAAAQTGHNIVSTECCALLGNLSIPRKKLLAHVNQQFSVGVNQIVWHGWADQTPGAATTWPGFSPFGPLVSDLYGPHNPTHAEDVNINAYVGRMQTVLRRGQLRNDVAIYRDSIGHRVERPGHLYFTDQSLARAGYTYGFLNDTLVADAKVTGKRLNAKRLGYRAFVLDNTPNVDTNPTMDLASAKRILSWAKSGLPVIVVGDLPGRVRGNHPAQDAELRAVNRELLATRGVQHVATQADVLEALHEAGVRPAASFAEPAPLVTLHRETTDTDYYYLFNSGNSQTTTTVTLNGRGRPYRYDAWTGAVSPIAEYASTSDGVTVEVTVESGDGALIGITGGNADTQRNPCTTNAISTTADEVLHRGDCGLAIRDTEAGSYLTQLGNGETVETTIEKVAASIAPADWTLNVTSWQAGLDGPNDTDKVALPSIPLRTLPATGQLPDWLTIPGLQNKSGIGTYRTMIDIPASWTGGTGAYLDLGDVRGLASVIVNGRRLPDINQVDPNGIDLGGYLRTGTNTITVRVSTLLGNAAYASAPNGPQSYGLVGPVVVRPYGQAVLSTTRGGVSWARATQPTGVSRTGSSIRARSRPSADAWKTIVPTSFGGRRIASAAPR